MTTLARPLKTETARRPAAALVGIGTAVPSLRVSQTDVLDFILKNFTLSDAARQLYRRAMAGDAISTRHFALNALDDALDPNPDRVIQRFERSAADLSAQSLKRALEAAGTSPRAIDFLVVATCTGYLCPGLSAYTLERVGLRSDARLADVVGMGCGAALPALEQANNFLAANPGAVAAVVCTEICSAALYSSNDPGIIVSNAIFADGSAAVILNSTDADGDFTGPTLARIRGFASETRPEWRDTLRFRNEGGRLKNVLERAVPKQSGEALAVVTRRLLASHDLEQSDLGRYVLHAGGSKILDEAEKALGLDPTETADARGVLKNYGNMSSPTVLFVLAASLAARPPSGELALLASFGAGFSAHAALLEL